MFSHAELLRAEIDKLDTWLAEQQLHLLYDNILRIRKKLRSALEYSYYLGSYLEDAIAVNEVLANQHDDIALNTLHQRATEAIGASSPPRKALGIAMMALSISLLILSMLVITTTLACAFPLAGFFLLLGGTASIMLGISFFRSGLQRGIARELDELRLSLRN